MLFVTVPFDYPYHPDPIDTMYRPSPKEIAFLLDQGSVEVLKQCIVKSSNFAVELLSSPKAAIKYLIRLLLPFINIPKWKSAVHRLKWLFRPYLISCVILRKK
jgi:hypothetical protein